MARGDPFKHHRFPQDVILLAVRWYCRYPLSYRDVRDLLAERGITVDAATSYRWRQKFGPEIRNRAYGKHRSWPGLKWHLDEAYVRVNGRRCAIDQRGELIDFQLAARRNANAARAFMRQACETAWCYRPLAIIMDKTHSYAKASAEMNLGCNPEDAIRHIDCKHLNNRIEGDHGAFKQPLKPKRGFRNLTGAKNILKGIETLRAIKKGHFKNNEPSGVDLGKGRNTPLRILGFE